jgi:predicted nuclease of predicted toxin-antitoxin system
MKFLADMGISSDTVSFLRQLDHTAVHFHEEGLHRLSDSDILLKAQAEGSVLLTHDLDFGGLMAAGGQTLPTVIIFRLKDMRPDNVNWYLREILGKHSQDLESGAMLSISENLIRVRHLPIS